MQELNFPNAVSNERDFFGRLDILAQIQTTLRSRGRRPIFVVGERRIGKTSLQNIAIQQLLSADPAQFHVFYIEPRGISSYSQFTQVILRRLAAWAKAAGGQELVIPQTASIPDDIEFESALSAILSQQKQQVLICIDEFDEIVRKLGRELPSLFGMLNYLIEKTRLPVYFFFTMTRVPQEMQEEIPSTLVSLSEVFELHPLSFEEMSRMTCEITAGRLAWPQEALEELFRSSGGHPYFAKLLISCLLDNTAHGISADNLTTVTGDLLARAVNSAIRDPRTEYVLDNLYRVQFAPEERAILLHLAGQGAPVALSDLQRAGWHWVTNARRLEKRHYLRIEDHTGCVDFQIAFLGEWLRRWIEFDLEVEKHDQLRKDLTQPGQPLIEVDDRLSVVRVCGQEVSLSAQEYKIMRRLAEDVEHLVTRDDLIPAAWDAEMGVSDQTIDTAIYRLRRKLRDQGHLIETNKTGRGFILRRAVLLKNKKDGSGAD